MTEAAIPVSNVNVQQFQVYESAGQPFGEVHWLRQESGPNGALYTGLWRHKPATFDYIFPGDETFHLLEGRVRIDVRGVGTVDLKPGDIVSFTKGQSSTWTIKETMKKFFVISIPASR